MERDFWLMVDDLRRRMAGEAFADEVTEEEEDDLLVGELRDA